jgi:hypothetical protein
MSALMRGLIVGENQRLVPEYVGLNAQRFWIVPANRMFTVKQ